MFIAVLNSQLHQCHSAVKIPVSTDVGHITSQTSIDTDCGTQKAPWVLEAKPGQKISTIIDVMCAI